nr:TctD-like protein [Hemiselmis andersenii]
MYKILIVDDEAVHTKATIKYLNSQGFNAIGTSSPQEGVNIAKKIIPDLIIVDIMMPKMDGYKFIKILTQNKNASQIPFIFLTAKGMTQDRIYGYSFGCSAYLTKPFAPEELVAIIQNILFRKKQTLVDLKLVLKEVKRIREYLENQYQISPELQISLHLTNREANVLEYIARGLKNKEIAGILKTSVRNVEKYVTKLLSKTNTKNRIELINYIYFNNEF